MKTKVLFAAILMTAVLITSAGYSAEEANTDGPQIFLPETKHAFSPVLEGAEILHNFTVQNKGTADLEIKEVKTS
jgi:hypothetical protein